MPSPSLTLLSHSHVRHTTLTKAWLVPSFRMICFPLVRHLLRKAARRLGMHQRRVADHAAAVATPLAATAGRSPFDAKSTLEGTALLAHSDYNLQ